MYKVFIVEDEHLIRESLRKQILTLSETYPITYVGEAGDGEMALASILDFQPDIILTDIKMPFMDGLTFAREARKVLPWTRIIFISGFDDFDYMKGAIQVQADEYLLKPIKTDELETTIARVVQRLSQQKQSTAPQSNSELLITEVKKNHFLNGLFKGDLDIPTAIKESQNFQRTIIGKKLTVLLATNQFNSNFEDYAHFSEYLNYLFSEDDSILFSSVSSHFIKFLIFDTQKEDVLEKSYQLAQTLIHELEQNSQDDIAVAIGPVVERISEISGSYQKAREMLATYGYLRTEKIISYEDDMKEGELSPTHPFKMDLADEISGLTQENSEVLVQKLCQHQDTFERTRMVRFFILTELTGLVKKKQQNAPEKFSSADALTNLIEISSSSEHYEKMIREMINYLIEVRIHPSMSKYQSVINHALTFINEKYTDPDISLNMVADELSLSPAHFSTIFSQSLGKTFIEYLTDQRINLAKSLLKETNQKLSEIAFEIGYNDPNYFSFIFKKKKGISPKEYRQKN
ncbi:response regulator [Enterococcus sp. BWT-B8]|uniref:helix-turn-helix domain-containing protein n=1 Tax=Enterococcus sp. BWT-B8 TaxID=2885157 RepID=UPI001E3387A3|nr:helix-turn-helix domain-containing protein [Enterococcus sp. BWT-B8]MCB5951984.1 response regulator [Enterococcus sp. BWT-B8]